MPGLSRVALPRWLSLGLPTLWCGLSPDPSLILKDLCGGFLGLVGFAFGHFGSAFDDSKGSIGFASSSTPPWGALAAENWQNTGRRSLLALKCSLHISAAGRAASYPHQDPASIESSYNLAPSSMAAKNGTVGKTEKSGWIFFSLRFQRLRTLNRDSERRKPVRCAEIIHFRSGARGATWFLIVSRNRLIS